MVKIIGTCGIIPVMLAFFGAFNPVRNRAAVITLIFFAFLLGFTYLYLIVIKEIPQLELINVLISFIFAILLIIFYPWKVGGYSGDSNSCKWSFLCFLYY